jgi:hypothetical protein
MELACSCVQWCLVFGGNDVQPSDSTSIQLVYYFSIHIDDVLCVISVQTLSFVAGDNILTAVSVARDCGMVLPYEQVIKVTAKVDSHHTDIQWEVVGAPQALSHGSFNSDSVSSVVALLESSFCISIMSLM